MNDVKVDDILRQIRVLSKEAGFDTSSGEIAEKNGFDFSSALKESINEVNQVQKNAGELAKSFELGDPNVNLSQVMIEMQKARISFEAITQVRNKLIAAYQEVMSMQV